MPTPPPRKFFGFQIHLSTAIVMMFVAGVLIWANTSVRIENRPSVGSNWWPHHFYGWPILVVEVMPEIIDQETKSAYWHLYLGNFALDLVMALVILFVAWLMCEDWLRSRRAARKGA